MNNSYLKTLNYRGIIKHIEFIQPYLRGASDSLDIRVQPPVGINN